MKNIKRILFLILIASIAFICIPKEIDAASVPTIKYKVHVQDEGWKKEVKNGNIAGTTGKSRRLEAIRIYLTSKNKSMIQYKVQVAKEGWQDWKSSGQLAGTTGKSLAIEAIQIKLTGDFAKKYDVYYRAYVREVGWLGWTKNGATAGSTGLDVRMEAIQIKLVKKGTKVTSTMKATLYTPKVKYDTFQNNKWTGTSGIIKKSLRMEALKLTLNDFKGKAGIRYKVYAQDSGWQPSWTDSGNVAGKAKSKKRIEAIKIELKNNLVKIFDVYYRAYVQDYGWLGWAKNGEPAGTMKGSLRVEAIEVKLVPKHKSIARGGTAFYDFSFIKNESQLKNLYSKSVSEASFIWYNDDAHTQLSCVWLTIRKLEQHLEDKGYHYNYEFNGNGKDIYGSMHDTDYFKVNKYSGSNCLNNLVANEGKRLENIIVSFPFTRNGKGTISYAYGHVVYIDQIVNGTVYWSDMDNYQQLKKGTIAEFLNRYSYPNGSPIGCIHVIKK